MPSATRATISRCSRQQETAWPWQMHGLNALPQQTILPRAMTKAASASIWKSSSGGSRPAPAQRAPPLPLSLLRQIQLQSNGGCHSDMAAPISFAGLQLLLHESQPVMPCRADLFADYTVAIDGGVKDDGTELAEVDMTIRKDAFICLFRDDLTDKQAMLLVE